MSIVPSLEKRKVGGETLETSMWKEGDKVIFTTRIVERDTQALGAAAVTLA